MLDMCTAQESNLQPYGVQHDAPTHSALATTYSYRNQVNQNYVSDPLNKTAQVQSTILLEILNVILMSIFSK